MYIVDADDFHKENTGFEYLMKIKKQIPNFKINLFTIIAKTPIEWLKNHQYDWINYIPHGYHHDTSFECSKWSYEKCSEYLTECEKLGYIKGFKAPGWQISNGMYKAAIEHDFWIADQLYNKSRWPEGLKKYLLDSPNKIHLHVGNVCGNGLQESMDKLLSLPKDAEFGFIDDLFK